MKRILGALLLTLGLVSVSWGALTDQSQWDFVSDTSISVTGQTYTMLESLRVVIDSAGGHLILRVSGQAIMDPWDRLYLAFADSTRYAAGTYTFIRMSNDTLSRHNEFIMSGPATNPINSPNYMPFVWTLPLKADTAGSLAFKLSGHVGGSGSAEGVTIRNLVVEVLVNATRSGQTTSPKEGAE